MITSLYGPLPDEIDEVTEFLNIKKIILNKPIRDIAENNISQLFLDESDLKINGLKKKVAKERYNYHLITVSPSSPSGASFAVRDNRVDMIEINTKLGLKVFNKKYANRVEEFNKIILVDLELFYHSKVAKDLRPLLRILETFKNSKICYYLTNKPNKLEHLRSYKGLQALGRVIGISNKSSHPKHVLNRYERNIEKIQGAIPFPGVEIDGSKD